MTRRRFRKQPTTMALFPFLAVLVCTMGALIMMLVLVVQQARVSASTEVRERENQRRVDAAEASAERQNLVDEAIWRQSVLTEQRTKKNEQLAQGRKELANLEDHIQELHDRFRRLEADAAEFQNVAQEKLQDRTAAEQELAELRTAIEQAARELEKAKLAGASKPKSYAIVPYVGPNGTTRRPLYLECRADGIHVQPEGLRLGPEIFEGPLGPGNPLDAVLRAKREYHARLEEPNQRTEPYPLLIVRPDGIEAYMAARLALKNWEDEFGYELVDATMQLKYPPPDPRLVEQLQSIVRNALDRQAALAAAMPSRFRARSELELPSAGGSDEGSALANSAPRRPGRGVGTGSGIGTGRSGAGDAGEMASQRNADLAGSGTSAARQNRGAAGQAGPGQAERGQAGPGLTGQGATERGSGAPGARPGGTAVTGQGSPAHPGGQTGPSPSLTFGQGAKNEGTASQASSGGSVRPLSNSRGRNFAVPQANESLVGVTRAIRVECQQDRLIVHPEKGQRRTPAVISLTEDSRRGMDQLLTQINKEKDGWGLALAGGYWKPVLKVEVAPGAEPRFAELQTLLHESGIVVERR